MQGAEMDGPEMRAIRKSLGLSQAALGEVIGLSRPTVNLMEAGKVPIERRTAIAVGAIARFAEEVMWHDIQASAVGNLELSSLGPAMLRIVDAPLARSKEAIARAEREFGLSADAVRRARST